MPNLRHKGMREFSGDEFSSLALGQNGFAVLSNVTVECGVTAGYENFKFFIALKAIDNDSEVKARTITEGHDLATDGVYSSGSALTLGEGDIIYGAFDKVTVSSGDYILAYIAIQHENG
mgnify:CR=1 FL=1